MQFEETLLHLKNNQNDFGDTIQDKIKKIDKALRKNIYTSTCDALFEKDKLLLAFLMSVALAPIDQKRDSKDIADKMNKNKMFKKLSMTEEEIDNEKRKLMYYENKTLFSREY